MSDAMAPLLHPEGASTVASVDAIHWRPVLLSIANVAKDSFSVSALTIPFAFALIGIPSGMLMVLLIGSLSAFTALRMQTAGDAFTNPGEEVVSFERLAQRAYGPRMDVAVRFTVVFTVSMATVGWFTAIGSIMSEVLGGSYPMWVWISYLGSIPLVLLPRIDSIGYASAAAVFFDFAALFIIVITGIVVAARSTSSDEAETQPLLPLLSSSDTTLAAEHPAAASVPLLIRFLWTFGIIKFSFAGHETFLMIAEELPNPKKEYPIVILGSFSCMLFFTLAFGASSVALFGRDAIYEDILDNVLTLRPHGIAVAITLGVGLSLHFTVPIIMLAGFGFLESFKWPETYNALSLRQRAMVRIPLLAVPAILATVYPNLANTVSIVGALGDSMLGFLFPALFYVRAQGGKWDFMSVVCIVTSAIGAVSGIVIAVRPTSS